MEEIHESLWNTLSDLDPQETCRRCGVAFHEESRGYLVDFLKERYLVVPLERKIEATRGFWENPSHGLKLAIINYLLNAKDIPLSGKWVQMKDMSGGSCFARSHKLSIDPLISKFGYNSKLFLERGLSIGGQKGSYGDASLIFPALPRIPILFILWEGDEEFPPRMSVLFDGGANQHMGLDALFMLAEEICLILSSHPVS